MCRLKNWSTRLPQWLERRSESNRSPDRLGYNPAISATSEFIRPGGAQDSISRQASSLLIHGLLSRLKRPADKSESLKILCYAAFASSALVISVMSFGRFEPDRQ